MRKKSKTYPNHSIGSKESYSNNQEVPNPDQTWSELWWVVLLPDAIPNVIYFKRILDLAKKLPLFDLFLLQVLGDTKGTVGCVHSSPRTFFFAIC